MKPIARKATLLNIAGNLFLFIIKLSAGIAGNSIAVISDAVNSMTDTLASVIVYIGVKMASRRADKCHPFGHHRAEPLAALMVAIFTAILGFEIIKASLERFISGPAEPSGSYLMVILAISICCKLALYAYSRKAAAALGSPALRASATDHRNDTLISGAALVGVIGSRYNNYLLEPIVAGIIGIWIIYSGYNIGRKNLSYLMGESPGHELLARIRNRAMKIRGVHGINTVKAHYVGVLLHVEIHIEVRSTLSLKRAHTIGKRVAASLGRLNGIDEVFVHIDPIALKSKTI
ncbi:MAG: cation diffusion facilitator family transporter [archaeon]